MRVVIILLLFLFLVPGVVGQLGEDVREYTIHAFNGTSSTGIVPVTEFEFVRPHTWEIGGNQSVVVLSANYAMGGGTITNPSATFRIVVNGVPYDNCTWQVHSEETASHGVTLHCLIAVLMPGVHTIAIERTAVVGTPVQSSMISIVIIQTESVIMENETLQTIMVLAPLLAFLLIVFWAERSNSPFVYLFAVLVGALSVGTLWGELETLRWVVLAGVFLVAVRGYASIEGVRNES